MNSDESDQEIYAQFSDKYKASIRALASIKELSALREKYNDLRHSYDVTVYFFFFYISKIKNSHKNKKYFVLVCKNLGKKLKESMK